MDTDSLIVRDPHICGGSPIFRGTRVPLRTILASLAEGDDEASILKAFPTLHASTCAQPSRLRPPRPWTTCRTPGFQTSNANQTGRGTVDLRSSQNEGTEGWNGCRDD